MKELENCYYCNSHNVYEFAERVENASKSTVTISVECTDCGFMAEITYNSNLELERIYSN